MVTIMDNSELLEKSKKFFEDRDIPNALETYEKAIDHVDRAKPKNKSEYILYLEAVLQYCKENNLIEHEALVLRTLGRTHSIFKQHAESMKFHYKSLKIQKRLGKKIETAEGLMFLAEDLEVSGNYDKSIEIFEEASELFKELGKLIKIKDITKEISRLREFSKTMIEEEYLLNMYHVDKY